MIRPPSLQREYTEFYSGDPAFEQLPESATDEQRKEHAHKWKVLRETGRLDGLLKQGEQPTQFQMLHIKRSDWRAFMDRMLLPPDSTRRIGPIAAPSILFRMAVSSIAGLDIEIKRSSSREWDGWEMAQPEVVEVLDSIDPRIVTEIGDQILTRMSDIQKKA